MSGVPSNAARSTGRAGGAGDVVAGQAVRGDGGGQVEAGLRVAERRRPGADRADAAAGARPGRAGRRSHQWGSYGRGPVNSTGTSVAAASARISGARSVGQTGHDDRAAGQPGLAQQVGDAVLGSR